MITFLCWYFGLSIAYTLILYLTLMSDEVFCLLLERSKDTQFNTYLNLRSAFLYLPITNIILSVIVSPINLVLLILLLTLQFISKWFVKVAGGQEEKFRLKAKYKVKNGGSDNK